MIQLIRSCVTLLDVKETPLLDVLINFLLNSTGNHTPGSRSYFDLMDTWADSLCIHQLVLKPCSKSTSTRARSN